jgi:hypothetical protein
MVGQGQLPEPGKPLFDAEWVAMRGPLPDLNRTEYRLAIASSTAELMAWEQSWAGEEVNAAATSHFFHDR